MFIIHHIITSCPKSHPACPLPNAYVLESLPVLLSCSLVIFHAAHLPLLHNSYMPIPDSLATCSLSLWYRFGLVGRLVKAMHLDVLVSCQKLVLGQMVMVGGKWTYADW